MTKVHFMIPVGVLAVVFVSNALDGNRVPAIGTGFLLLVLCLSLVHRAVKGSD